MGALIFALVLLHGAAGPMLIEPNNVAAVFSMPGVGVCPTAVLTSGGTVLYVCDTIEKVCKKFGPEKCSME